MKILVDVPENTKWVEINAYLSADEKHPFGAEDSKVYSGDKFHAIIVKEPDTIYELTNEEIMRVYHAQYDNHKHAQITLDCGVTQGRCTFNE